MVVQSVTPEADKNPGIKPFSDRSAAPSTFWNTTDLEHYRTVVSQRTVCSSLPKGMVVQSVKPEADKNPGIKPFSDRSAAPSTFWNTTH